MIRLPAEMLRKPTPNCHHGRGQLETTVVIDRSDELAPVPFMHDNIVPAGASIGVHEHDHYEIYYVLEGAGTLIYDGQRNDMPAGSVNVVEPGHSHGLENAGVAPMRLLVVGLP
ncbi:MAG: cupin domain-containing protein [Phycisphaerae bacterium]